MALRALYGRVPPFEPPDVVENTDLTKSVPAIYDSMGESEEALANVASQHMSQLLFSH